MHLYWSVFKAVLLCPLTYSASYTLYVEAGTQQTPHRGIHPQSGVSKSVYTACVLAKEAKAAFTPSKLYSIRSGGAGTLPVEVVDTELTARADTVGGTSRTDARRDTYFAITY